MTLRLDDTGFFNKDIGKGNIKIYQDSDIFCYGVDAVILADFAAGRKNLNRILDLGTGNGVIPLILSHKTSAPYIVGIEVQEKSYGLAVKNAEFNELSHRVQFVLGNVNDANSGMQALRDESFDAVTCNPPYFTNGASVVSKNPEVAIARQEVLARLEDFLLYGKRKLRDKGEFFLIHRPERLVDILSLGRQFGLEAREIRLVANKAADKPKMVLVRMIKGGGRNLTILEPLIIHKDDGSYTDEILKIYERI